MIKYSERDEFIETFYVKNYYIEDGYRSELIIFTFILN